MRTAIVYSRSAVDVVDCRLPLAEPRGGAPAEPLRKARGS
jgi:hypothetical protein